MVFVRRNVSLDSLFTLTFLTVGTGLFFARLFYVLFHFQVHYLNPLVFFVIFYFPGLSFPGGLLSGAVFLFFYTRKRKMPLAHVVDFFGLGLLGAVPFGYIADIFLSHFSPFQHVFLPILLWILFGLGVAFLLPRSLRQELKPGTLGASSILVISFVNFLVNVLNSINAGVLKLSASDAVSLLTFILSFIFFIKQEYILSKVKK
jgi:prolipoprotein diacylglyceryltransferase